MHPPLEHLARAAHMLTVQRFGKTIKLFAPLYLSNACINDCSYCGFKRDLNIPRVTLTVEQVVTEARALIARGFRHLLLVAGEHPKEVSLDYLEACARTLRPQLAELSIEVQPFFDEASYRRLHEAGVDGVVIFQETYNRKVYRTMHHFGPKADFAARLEAIAAAGRAGMRSLGIGALLGLADWREEMQALITHARALAQRHWRAAIAVSFPRITPTAGGFTVPSPVSDRELVEIICTVRLALPDAELVLSTRERPSLRDGLLKLGITRMSAGSSTEPGGYTHPGIAAAQFSLGDHRSPAEVAAAIARAGYTPVWKDGDAPAAHIDFSPSTCEHG